MSLRSCRLTMLLALTSLVLPALASMPGTHADHSHDALQVDDSLSLTDVVNAALARTPLQAVPEARRQEAEVLASRSGSPLSGSPALLLRHQTDRWQSRLGAQEWEAGVELPLWRWGQRSALASEAGHAERYALLYAQLRRWLVAGQVREAYWLVQLSDWLEDRARLDLGAWRQLEQDVLRRIQAGDAAPAERLVAEGARRERELMLHEAETRHVDSEVQWRLLTGLDRLPTSREETLALADDSPWPPVAAARELLAKQQDALDSARALGAGPPRLLLGSRREQVGSERIDSLGATLTLPFGGPSHQRQALVTPTLQQAEAADALRQAERDAAIVRHEARHELNARRIAAELGSARLGLSRDEIRLARRAYVLGEISLNERLLAEQRHAEVERQHGVARLQLALAIARYNQAWGVTP